MGKASSQWSKEVRKALIDRDMSMTQLAESIGYSFAVVSSVINGRYANRSYQAIAEKINEKLGTTGMPERTATPSDEWCEEVKSMLPKKKMDVGQLASEIGVSRGRLSLVINGKMMNKEIVDDVNRLLDIHLAAVPAGDS